MLTGVSTLSTQYGLRYPQMRGVSGLVSFQIADNPATTFTLTPNHGPIAGGETIVCTVDPADFANDLAGYIGIDHVIVTFDGVACAFPYTLISPSSFSVVNPAHAAGVVAVNLFRDDGD